MTVQYPDLNDPAVRSRLNNFTLELADELPRDRGDALIVLANLLCMCAESVGAIADVIPLVRSAQSRYRYDVPTPAPTPQPDVMRALPRGGRRPSARRGRP